MRTLVLGLILTCLFSGLVQAQTELGSYQSPLINAVSLTSSEQAQYFANQILTKIDESESDKVLVLRLQHMVQDGSRIPPYLREALTIIDQELSRQGKQDRFDLELTLIDRNEYSKGMEEFRAGLPSEEQLEHYLLIYEQENGSVDASTRQQILQYFHPREVVKRMHQAFRRTFGVPNGLTFYSHIFEEREGNRVQRFKGKRNARLAIVTALLAMTSFSLSVASPSWGIMDAFGPVHIRSAATLGLWVGFCIYYIKELVSFKTQGRSVEINSTASSPNQLRLTHNRSFYMASSIVQELIVNTLVTGAIMGPVALLSGGLHVWVVLIGSNAVLSALSYIPAESMAASLFAREGALRAQAEREALSEKADELRNEANRVGRKANIVLNVWWNLLFPAAKWGGFMLTLAMADPSGPLEAVGRWTLANIGLIGFGAYGIVRTVRELLPEWRSPYRSASPCAQSFVLFKR